MCPLHKVVTCAYRYQVVCLFISLQTDALHLWTFALHLCLLLFTVAGHTSMICIAIRMTAVHIQIAFVLPHQLTYMQVTSPMCRPLNAYTCTVIT